MGNILKYAVIGLINYILFKTFKERSEKNG